jgi:4-carboxymuconolactone decarboxylase
MTDETLPPDIDPESRSRLPFPKREDLDTDSQAIYDHFTDPNSTTYVGLRGPGGIRLHSPQLAQRIQRLNRYLRWEADIDPRLRELVILVTARALDSQFEWTAHEPVAQKRGVPQGTIDAIKYRRPLDGLADDDAAVIRFVRELMEDRKVTPATYAVVLEMFGDRMLVDLVGLIGNYAATAAILTAFDMQLHPEWEPLLPKL